MLSLRQWLLRVRMIHIVLLLANIMRLLRLDLAVRLLGLILHLLYLLNHGRLCY